MTNAEEVFDDLMKYDIIEPEQTYFIDDDEFKEHIKVRDKRDKISDKLIDMLTETDAYKRLNTMARRNEERERLFERIKELDKLDLVELKQQKQAIQLKQKEELKDINKQIRSIQRRMKK